jgi:threonylcarbamoyladenosine tRNA methylthiotransferase MtaB
MDAKLGGETINARVKRLNGLCQKLHRNFYVENAGREEKVLFESAVKKGVMYGFTRNYIKTEIPYRKDLAGKIVRVKLLNIAGSGNLNVELIDNDYL